ncbi:hypothetical protein OUZ56_030872 [Daphnia magna]|uniref:Uncharacterized protein n=1 Tax=Daphnia magna TaxID=35525 RepID=A0ABQ9ZSJ5_9CRUS|nr:hypothetical protein OUZ56_030872 [Daphnia magna]
MVCKLGKSFLLEDVHECESPVILIKQAPTVYIQNGKPTKTPEAINDQKITKLSADGLKFNMCLPAFIIYKTHFIMQLGILLNAKIIIADIEVMIFNI